MPQTDAGIFFGSASPLKQDKKMQILQNVEYGGERPLFALRSAELDHVVIHPGESALKHVENIRPRLPL